MSKNLQTVPLLVGLSLCGASAAILYVWYKSKNSSRDQTDSRPRGPLTRAKLAGQKASKVECAVSNDVVPLIIGRNGTNVKSIEDQTNTKILFRRKDDAQQVCEISGTYENVMKAANLIKEQASRSTNVTDEVSVSHAAFAKVFGRYGKTLQEICRKSHTQVHIDSGLAADKSSRRVLITGSRANVNLAKRLIDEKIAEDAEEREAEIKREPRHTPRSGPSSAVSLESLPRDSSITTSNERLNIPTGMEGHLKVYVSAIASPSRFWIQIVGPQTTKLDQLVEEMTEYYNQVENRELHKINDPYLGQIVTAMFKYDSKWYRAEVVGILPNEYDPRNVVLDLYFLDYGDSEFVQPHEVYEIRTDFLTLRFQAIECFLAHCQPMYPTTENQWNGDATSRFEELTHVAKWKQLTAKVVTTKERFKNGDGFQREGSPVPGIELYDIVEDRELSLASQLILEGFALPDNHVDIPKPLSRYSSSESVNSSQAGSVAEKALMFELNATLNNGNGNSHHNKSNGKLSPTGQRSPSRFTTSPKPKRAQDTQNNTQTTEKSPSTSKSQSKSPSKSPTKEQKLNANNNESSYVPYETMLKKSWAEMAEESDTNT